MDKFTKYRYQLFIRRWTRRLVFFAVLSVVTAVGIFGMGGIGGDVVSGLENRTGEQLVDDTERVPQEEMINRTQVEGQIHYFVNKERSERGLRRLSSNPDLQEPARYHSEHMASETYFSHKSPNGNDFTDRYDRFGVECSISVSENMKSGGAENIAYTYAFEDIRADNGKRINHYGNETSIARGIVSQWMNSSSHREIILEEHWGSEGIGVAVSEFEGKTRIYATQNFC